VRSRHSSSSADSAPRIYTRTGDRGTSSLFTGERRAKSDEAFHALGAVDELSSHVGLAMESARESDHAYVDNLCRVQCLLQDIGSALATPASSARDAHVARLGGGFNKRHTLELEEWIDEYSSQLAPLQNFILPGGGLTSAHLHVARAVCRRAERHAAPLAAAGEVDQEVLRYLNRLSDLLFTLARTAAKLDGKEETIYLRPEEHTGNYQPGPDGMWKKKK